MRKPKRAKEHMLEGAPSCILACYERGGRFKEDYTVLLGGDLFWDPTMGDTVRFIEMSPSRDGVVGNYRWDIDSSRVRRLYGKPIRWAHLPEYIRQFVTTEVRTHP